MADYVSRLDSIQDGCQTDGWDGNHANAVTNEAIRVARNICDSLWVSPTNAGGVQLTWGNKSINLNIGADGHIQRVYMNLEEFDDWVTSNGRERSI